jgi:copper(I)-binding protein
MSKTSSPTSASAPARTSSVPAPAMSPAIAAAVRSVGPPLSAALLLIVVLSCWVTSGGFGTIARVRISVVDATVPMPATPGLTAAYLTIDNSGDKPDELLSVQTASAGRTMLAQNSSSGPSGTMKEIQGIAVPAHGSATLGPFGVDVMLSDTRPLHVGQVVTLILTFRTVGQVTVQAAVTPPGTA